MRKKGISILILLISVTIISLPGISEALLLGPSDYSGYRSADPNDTYYGITATSGWSDPSGGYFKISWEIDYDTSYGFKYVYTFDTPVDGGDLSHFIIEVSGNATSDNFDIDQEYELKTHEVESSGNPGMPANIYGIKIEPPVVTGSDQFTIYSDRAPKWGDIYSKNGTGTYAYNIGFGTEPTLADYPYKEWIAVPDTETVIPEPGTLILMILGILGFAGAGLKRKLH